MALPSAGLLYSFGYVMEAPFAVPCVADAAAGSGGGGVSRERFSASVKKVHAELVETRGNKPLKAYVDKTATYTRKG